MSANEVTWRQPANGKVSPPRVSAVGYLAISLVCLALGLLGPVLLVVAAVVDLEIPWWALLLTAVTVLGLMFFAFTLWLTYKHGRRDTKLIDASGVPATAEILSVGDARWAEQEGVRLALRITGPGFEPFETTFEWKNNREFAVGGRLAVLVEPTARLFEVKV